MNEQKARNRYRVQWVSAFSACLLKTQLMKALPYAIRPAKNFTITLIYHLLRDKMERNFDAIRETCASSASNLSALKSAIGSGKHHR